MAPKSAIFVLLLVFPFICCEQNNCDESCELEKFGGVKTIIKGMKDSNNDMKSNIVNLESRLNMIRDERAWTLAFKVEAGSHICTYCAWKSPNEANPQSYEEAIDLKTKCGCSYVNHKIMSNWTEEFANEKTQVSFSFWKRSPTNATHVYKVASILFDGSKTGNLSWFDRKRVLESSFADKRHWEDERINFFSIEGQETKTSRDSRTRRFFVNRNGTTCSTSNGWMMVVDAEDTCSWANDDKRFPVFAYMKERSGLWSGNNRDYADIMTIFVR